MIKIYSKTCEHVLRVLREITQNDSKDLFIAKDLCHQADVPEYSARKGLQLLVSKKVLKAVPGPGGGYRFAKDPQKITVLDIIHMVDGESSYLGCVMGFPSCNHRNPCPLHNDWKELRAAISERFKSITLYELFKKRISL